MASLPAPAAQSREQLSGTGYPSDYPHKYPSTAQDLHLSIPALHLTQGTDPPGKTPQAVSEAGQHGDVCSKGGKGDFLPCQPSSHSALFDNQLSSVGVCCSSELQGDGRTLSHPRYIQSLYS